MYSSSKCQWKAFYFMAKKAGHKPQQQKGTGTVARLLRIILGVSCREQMKTQQLYKINYHELQIPPERTDCDSMATAYVLMMKFLLFGRMTIYY